MNKKELVELANEFNIWEKSEDADFLDDDEESNLSVARKVWFIAFKKGLAYMANENAKLTAQLKEATEWQPIETAPYGVWILIYAYNTVTQACWHCDGFWETFNDNRILPSAAECWTPLPSPPEALKKLEKEKV